jgi:hypothetical protein
MPKENLVCELCECSWQREQSRGRKPRLCPNCLSAPEPQVQSSSTKRIIIEDPSLRRPTLKVVDTTVKPIKYKGKNDWICPHCRNKVKTFVGLTEEPMHWCRGKSSTYLPLELSRQEA